MHRQLNLEKFKNPLTTPPPDTVPADEDLAEQANPGHGIASQDPNAAAQTALDPQQADREANSVLLGVAWWQVRPRALLLESRLQARLGVLAAATVGAIAGAAGGAAAGATGRPTH